ncbi:MAG TPA: peptidoglycan-associated lipoprotein Pal [Thermoanaerobaculia bacterium]|nr:peptidoglycan-associated lipoprotein Pal [Thermoanaerobaculia bacterium]
MKRLSTPLVALAFVAAAILPLAQGCKKKPPTTTEEARPPVEQPAPPETRVPPPPAPPAAMPEESIESTPLDVLNQKGYLKDAYFDYDQSDLRDDARSALSGNAEWLKRFPSIQVLIEGHCDERGTSAYNLALGDRRANAARDYLDSLGVAASRIRTVSYGKERPSCTDASEDCYQQNRRAHFVITAK